MAKFVKFIHKCPFEQSSDYDKVKELILKAYELLPEAYRQKFRNCRKENDQTHVEFARTKEQLFDRWCSSKKICSDYPKFRQLMLVEEFKRCINSDFMSLLDEKEVETLEKAARLADDYTLTQVTPLLIFWFNQWKKLLMMQIQQVDLKLSKDTKPN